MTFWCLGARRALSVIKKGNMIKPDSDPWVMSGEKEKEEAASHHIGSNLRRYWVSKKRKCVIRSISSSQQSLMQASAKWQTNVFREQGHHSPAFLVQHIRRGFRMSTTHFMVMNTFHMLNVIALAWFPKIHPNGVFEIAQNPMLVIRINSSNEVDFHVILNSINLRIINARRVV